MNVTVNGEPKQVPEGLSIQGLLAHLGVSAPRVAVELNRLVVRRAEHGTTPLREGDQLEIVAFVGGG